MKKYLFLIVLVQSICCFSQSFTNPIFKGDYPDPSILVDGDDYYIVHSSFEYYPGLTIWHSTDLIHWNPVQSPLTKYLGSVWAPDLVKYNGKYFIYFPAEDYGKSPSYKSNYVIWADKIDGNWSDPVDLKIDLIDPGHIADKKGNRYLYFSSGSYIQLTKDGLSTVGNLQPSYEGWDIPREWSIECFCMEGPKLTKHGEYYYLTVAEGGTAGPPTGHMVVSARSKSPCGPWENSPYNPIIRAKTPEEQWCSIGHATIFEDAQQKWWMIFHGYEKNFYTLGRQTLMLPIEWTNDGWWKVADDYKVESPIKIETIGNSQISEFSLSDSFEGATLRPHWKFWKEYNKERFFVKDNSLTVKAQGNDVVASAPLLCMPANHSYSVQVEVKIEGSAVGGLVLFYSPKIYSGILADSSNIQANLRGWQFVTESNVLNKKVILKLENRNNIVDMFYSTDGLKWEKISNSFDASAYHHNVLSDFLALRVGLVSMGQGSVTFKNFVYKSLDK